MPKNKESLKKGEPYKQPSSSLIIEKNEHVLSDRELAHKSAGGTDNQRSGKDFTPSCTVATS